MNIFSRDAYKDYLQENLPSYHADSKSTVDQKSKSVINSLKVDQKKPIFTLKSKSFSHLPKHLTKKKKNLEPPPSDIEKISHYFVKELRKIENQLINEWIHSQESVEKNRWYRNKINFFHEFIEDLCQHSDPYNDRGSSFKSWQEYIYDETGYYILLPYVKKFIVNLSKTLSDLTNRTKPSLTNETEWMMKELKNHKRLSFHHKSREIMLSIFFHIETILDREVFEILTKTSSIKIKDLLDQIKYTKWGHETLKRENDLAERWKKARAKCLDLDRRTSGIISEKNGLPIYDDKDIQLLLRMVDHTYGFDVERLTTEGIIAKKNLLLSYKSVMSSEKLFESINTILRDVRIPFKIKERLLNFIMDWMRSNLYDRDLFKDDVQLQLDEIIQYFEYYKSNLEKEFRLHEILMKKKMNAKIEKSNISKKQRRHYRKEIEEALNRAKCIGGDYSKEVKDFANRLVFLSKNIANIELNDFFLPFDSELNSTPNFKVYTKAFNNLSYWIIDLIVQQPNLKEAWTIANFFADVGNLCISHYDFSSAQAIFAALQSSSVDRLLDGDVIFAEKLKEPQLLFSMEFNFKNIRDCLKKVKGKPYAAYLGVVTKDFRVMLDSIPTIKKEKYNVAKLNALANLSREVIRHKNAAAQLLKQIRGKKYHLFKEYIRTYKPLTESEQYNYSLKLKSKT